MKKLIYIFIVACIALSANAQKLEQNLKKADEAYKNFEFQKAIRLYNNVAEDFPDNAIVKEKLANLYLTPGPHNNTDLAMRYLQDAFKTGQMSPAMQGKYAALLQSQSNFNKAAEVYANINSTSLTKNALISSADLSYYDKISKPIDGAFVKNLVDINSENSDFSPMFYKDGIVFVSTRKNRANTGFTNSNQIIEHYSDLFHAKFTDPRIQSFSEPTLFVKNVDLKYMQGPVTFSDAYAVMYGTRSAVDKTDKALQSTDDNKTVLLEVFKSNYKNDLNDWSENSQIVLNRGMGYQNFSYAHPAFASPLGDEMIFASNMPGGFGGTDLYYSRLINNEWSTPVNLGPEINTAGQEMFPYVAKDKTLYFASSGLPGLGGLDIFKAKGTGSSYSSVQNIGAPFNSSSDDFGFIIKEGNGDGYLTSNRPGGLGDDDIYYWKGGECKVTIRVYAASTNENLPGADVKVPIKNKAYKTDSKGLVVTNCEDVRSSEIIASNEGYVSKKVAVKEIASNKIINIPLDKDYGDKCRFMIVVLDKETKEPIADANVTVKQISTSDEVTGKSKADGTLKVSGIDMNESYEVFANKLNEDGSKYIGNPEKIACTPKEPETVKYLYLTRVVAGTKIRLENIYYDLNKWAIKPRAAIELDNLVHILKQNPSMEIEMGSHTDCRAPRAYNETLSGKRAASSVEYIISRGINPSRLTSKGYGESELTNDCPCEGTKKSTCTEEQHQANRRTEFKIIKL
jgi:outer membrane protein OmpA-like peptidoglycan-associated protein/tetratricopeptide (TPR) repeat protein